MNRFLKVAFCCLLASLAVLPAQAAKPFYDSKSWIVNVAGDPSFLISNGFESKVNPVALQVPHLLNQEPTAEVCREIAADLTERGIGKEMIDALTGNGMNDAVLRRLALANAQRQDVELGTSTMRFESGDALFWLTTTCLSLCTITSCSNTRRPRPIVKAKSPTSIITPSSMLI